MQLTKEDWIFIVTTFNNVKKVSGVIRLFRDCFKGKSKNRITVRKKINKDSGRPVTKRTQRNITMVICYDNEHFFDTTTWCQFNSLIFGLPVRKIWFWIKYELTSWKNIIQLLNWDSTQVSTSPSYWVIK